MTARKTLLLIALVTLAPVVASYVAYYWFPRDARANYGELLPTRPAPDVAGRKDGAPFTLRDVAGKWVLAVAAPASCDAACAQALYATRQARTIQNREMERVTRVWFVTGAADPDPALLAQHPDLAVVRTDGAALAAWGAGSERIYLLDPLGNLVLAYPRDPDIKAMARDLTRLLKASRIG
jgi:cytochrome oxidase Cu insertion factor (SCO1/SenC/PrrC family)